MIPASATTTLAPTALLDAHAAEMPQKDQLCGAFWGCMALRAHGIVERDGEPVDQDLVARESGSSLAGRDADPGLPPDQDSRLDYRLELPVAEDAATSGTASEALARAIAHVAGGALAVVPVAGPWTGESVTALLARVEERAPEAVLVANLRTGRLWGSRPSPVLALEHLAGVEVTAPQPDWDEGHFVGLGYVVRGTGGMLVGVLDTYRSLGADGHHLQPPAAIAAALRRDDGRGGGVLCVTRADREAALREALAAEGFALEHWDNGSVAV
jgi:hypothetical protein